MRPHAGSTVRMLSEAQVRGGQRVTRPRPFAGGAAPLPRALEGAEAIIWEGAE